jgi:hypothetical protein
MNLLYFFTWDDPLGLNKLYYCLDLTSFALIIIYTLWSGLRYNGGNLFGCLNSLDLFLVNESFVYIIVIVY